MSTHAPVQSGPEPAADVAPRRRPLSGGLGLVVVVVLLGVAGYTTYRTFSAPPQTESKVQYVDMICAKSLKHFPHILSQGEAAPVLSPYSKERTGWPAEKCYWTRDGNAKLKPDYVLLNEYINKPGPTLCPVCGRLVVAHNQPPPPDKMEAARRAEAAAPPAAAAATPTGGAGHAH